MIDTTYYEIKRLKNKKFVSVGFYSKFEGLYDVVAFDIITTTTQAALLNCYRSLLPIVREQILKYNKSDVYLKPQAIYIYDDRWLTRYDSFKVEENKNGTSNESTT